MTHAGIDGYSRMIVYLSCSANNRADTVYKLFLQAVRRYSLPSRVRSDQGGENRLVALHMIRHRGAERRSMIVGSSVHNQRVERLWRDLYQSTIRLYYRLFYYLEARGCLDPVNALHLYSLHYVFKPRINISLLQFQDGWNHHGIRTVNNESPYQIFTAGALQLQHSGLAGLDFFTAVDDSYDAEEVGLTPQDDDQAAQVEVPRIEFHLVEDDFLRLKQLVNPLQESHNYGIALYEAVLEYVCECIRLSPGVYS